MSRSLMPIHNLQLLLDPTSLIKSCETQDMWMELFITIVAYKFAIHSEDWKERKKNFPSLMGALQIN